MQNPFGHLILELQKRIRTQVPQIREVAEDKGQLEHYDTKPAVSFPCVLIDFDFNFDDMGDNTQMADGQVVLRLAFPPYSSSSSLMPDLVKEKGLSYTDIEWNLNKALHGWQPANMGYLARRKAQTEMRRDPLRVREIRYEMSFEDYSAQDQHTFTPRPDLDVSGEF